MAPSYVNVTSFASWLFSRTLGSVLTPPRGGAPLRTSPVDEFDGSPGYWKVPNLTATLLPIPWYPSQPSPCPSAVGALAWLTMLNQSADSGCGRYLSLT